jgi:hypothetical protein
MDLFYNCIGLAAWAATNVRTMVDWHISGSSWAMYEYLET